MQLCKLFEKGFCRLGKFCNFAHGENDLEARGIKDSST